MTDEQKQYISLHLDILKNALKKEGLCFALIFSNGDFNESHLEIVDSEKLKSGKVDGMKISLEKMNEGLI